MRNKATLQFYVLASLPRLAYLQPLARGTRDLAVDLGPVSLS